MRKSNSNRFVVFLDILGFSNLIMKSEPNEIMNKFYKIFLTILSAVLKEIQQEVLQLMADPTSFARVNSLIKKIEEGNELIKDEQTLKSKNKLDLFLKDYFKLNYMIVSDSIIIYSNIINEDSLNISNNFATISEFTKKLISISFQNQVPLRGGMSFGEFIVDIENSIYFGKAFIDAVNLEKEQEWIGCTISNEIKDLTENYLSLNPIIPLDKNKLQQSYYVPIIFSRAHVVNKYYVPFKKNNDDLMYIINWYPSLIGKVNLNDSFFDEELTGIKSIDIKYHNTLNYMKWWESILNDSII